MLKCKWPKLPSVKVETITLGELRQSGYRKRPAQVVELVDALDSKTSLVVKL